MRGSADHHSLYAINEAGKEGRVRSFRIAPADGSLTPLTDVPSGGAGPCHVSLHPNGKWLFVAHYGSGHVAVLPLANDGSVGPAVDVHLAGSHAHMAITDHAGRFLMVPCLGSDYIALYDIDAATGHLTPHVPATIPVAKGAGPRHLAFHPSERMAYVLNELDSTLTSFAYDAANSAFSEPQTISTLPSEFHGKNSTAHVRVTADGRMLYASNRGHDSIASCALDPQSLRPQAPHWETAGGEIRTPRHFTLDDAGTLAVVASQGADLLTLLRVDPNGTWTRLGAQATTKAPTFVGVMPAP